MLTSRRVCLQLLGWGTVAALGATLLLGAGPAVEASSAGLHAAPEVSASSESGSAYTALAPTRLLDTRTTSPLGPGESLNLDVLVSGVSAQATAVALNLTATDSTSAGYLSAYPTGGSLPGVSNLNWVAGETVANLAIVPVGSGGDVTFHNSAGSTEVVVDLEGFFAAATTTAGSYVPLAPDRVTDTRSGSGYPNEGQPLGASDRLQPELGRGRDGGKPGPGAGWLLRAGDALQLGRYDRAGGRCGWLLHRWFDDSRRCQFVHRTHAGPGAGHPSDRGWAWTWRGASTGPGRDRWDRQ